MNEEYIRAGRELSFQHPLLGGGRGWVSITDDTF